MHLTDEQLNEYLDHETDDRAEIELHLAACEVCSARLAAMGDLFSEIEALPDLELSQDFSTRFEPRPSRSAGLPRSLTWTMTLQVTLAVIAIIVAAPFMTQFLSPDRFSLSAPSLTEISIPLQRQWIVWLDALSTLTLPTFPEIPVANVSNLSVIFTVIGVSLVWLVGNGLLLRNQMK